MRTATLQNLVRIMEGIAEKSARDDAKLGAGLAGHVSLEESLGSGPANATELIPGNSRVYSVLYCAAGRSCCSWEILRQACAEQCCRIWRFSWKAVLGRMPGMTQSWVLSWQATSPAWSKSLGSEPASAAELDPGNSREKSVLYCAAGPSCCSWEILRQACAKQCCRTWHLSWKA